MKKYKLGLEHKNYEAIDNQGYFLRSVPIELKARYIPHLFRSLIEIEYKNVSNDVAWVHRGFLPYFHDFTVFNAETSTWVSLFDFFLI